MVKHRSIIKYTYEKKDTHEYIVYLIYFIKINILFFLGRLYEIIYLHYKHLIILIFDFRGKER